jgi:hypothetical protein
MVKAELTYNPYLLETAITFNGNEPKINSAVLKYRNKKLQNWIEKLPTIFYNEMNGWDFTLDFSGTTVDCEDICSAFSAESIGGKTVNIIHKNELESAPKKERRISDLLTWFENNPNRKFNFKKFRDENVELFDTDYPFVVYGGAVQTLTLQDVTVESILSVSELENASLENTPILFNINQSNAGKYLADLSSLIADYGIIPSQIFFTIEPALNQQHVVRTIQDIGIPAPKVVESVSADIIKRYFEVFPKTDFIYQVIKLLQKEQFDIGNLLSTENEASAIANSDIRREIDRYEEILRKLKASSEEIANRDKYVFPIQLEVEKNNFIAKISNWRKRKIKMTTDEEADMVSLEMKSEIATYFSEFITQIRADVNKSAERIISGFARIYNSAEFKDFFTHKEIYNNDFAEFVMPEIIPDLIKLKEVKYVDRNIGVLGIFRADNNDQVRQIEYSYQKWRDTATVKCTPVLDEVISKAFNVLSDFNERVAESYFAHLQTAIAEQTTLKDDISAKLSDDERELQADNDWFADFSEKLRQIERS